MPLWRPWSGRVRALGRGTARAARVSLRQATRTWARLRPPQQLVLGFATYVVIGTALLALPFAQHRLAAFVDNLFNVTSAISTAGFNTIPISPLSAATLLVIALAMLIGASPSGTGGGIKTTTVSALLADLMSVLRGRTHVIWLGREVPLVRVLHATASATFYLGLLAVGILLLCVTESEGFLPIAFEAASALGTVGLSMGITGDLSIVGKLVVIVLMFAGRCGPLTLGLALLRPDPHPGDLPGDDLAV